MTGGGLDRLPDSGDRCPPETVANALMTDADAGVAMLNATYRVERPVIGVELRDGVGELDLAAAFDAWNGQSFSARTVALGDGRTPVVSAHGLRFVPRADRADADVDRRLTPGGPGFPFDAALAGIARTADVPTARYAAKMLEYPQEDVRLEGPGLPFGLWMRPVLAGVVAFGLLVGAGVAAGRLRARGARRAGAEAPGART